MNLSRWPEARVFLAVQPVGHRKQGTHCRASARRLAMDVRLL
jgi:hypothetical protein